MMILTLLRPFLPHLLAALFAFGAGWSAAWYVQGLRVTSGKQDLVDCTQKNDRMILEAQRSAQQAKDRADQITKEVNDAIPQYVGALHDYYRRHPVVRLLPAAGGHDPNGPLSGPAASPRSGPTDPVPDPEAGPLTADEQRRAVAALEACGETTVLFVQCRAWAKRQRDESLKEK